MQTAEKTTTSGAAYFFSVYDGIHTYIYIVPVGSIYFGKLNMDTNSEEAFEIA